MKIKKPKITNVVFENCKELIKLYIHTNDKFSYPKEIAIAKKLLKLIPDILFWQQYDPDRKFHSLSIFLTPAAKKELSKEYSLFLLTKPREEIRLEKEPVIEIEEIKTNKKNKTLLEFIDNTL